MPNNKKYVSDYPELLAEWDNDRNIGLLPSNVSIFPNLPSGRLRLILSGKLLMVILQQKQDA